MLYFWRKIIPIWIRTFLWKEVCIDVTDFFSWTYPLSQNRLRPLCLTVTQKVTDYRWNTHCTALKFRFSEKTTKIRKKNLPLVLTLLSKRQNMWEIVFTILWPFHKILTLKTMMDKSEKVIANIIDNKTFLSNV